LDCPEPADWLLQILRVPISSNPIYQPRKNTDNNPAMVIPA
jgi:hypothetical protein